MTQHEKAPPPQPLDAILTQATQWLDRATFGEERAERFEQLVKSGLQDFYDDLVTFGFVASDNALRPPGYVLGKLEGYMQVLTAWGDAAAAQKLEDFIARTMVVANKVRIPG